MVKKRKENSSDIFPNRSIISLTLGLFYEEQFDQFCEEQRAGDAIN